MLRLNHVGTRASILCALMLGIVFSLTSSRASAQLPDVAIVAAAATSSTAGQFTDPQAKLMGTGLFNSVTIVNAATSTPTLAQLQAFDAVMTWSNVNYQNNVAMGDVLADYVDGGGGVVVAVFANATTTAARVLGGRWETGGYEIIDAPGTSTTGAASLGNILVPGHPIMQGVNTFAGGTSSFRPSTTAVTPGSTRIAEWSDGRTLVAVGASPQRADLGFYPPSNAVSSTWWDQNTDGARLMANALLYTIPEPSMMGLAGLGLLALARRR
jgi:hypothetical protein